MKRITLILFIPLLAVAQPKHNNSIDVTGTWADSCKRLVFLNEGSGTTLDDKSSGTNRSLNTTTGVWQTDKEGTYATVNNPSTAYIEFSTGLPTASCQAFTLYLRMKYDADVTNGAFLGTFTCSPTPTYDFMFGEPAATTREFQWRVFNASGTEATCNPANNLLTVGEKYNFICTYDGANIRLYYDNIEVASAALTGNMRVSSYTFRIGQAARTDGSACSVPLNSLYIVAVWTRVLSATERALIQRDPYVMVRPVMFPQVSINE